MARKSERNFWKIIMLLPTILLIMTYIIFQNPHVDIAHVPISTHHPSSYPAPSNITPFISPHNKSIAWQKFVNGTGSIFIIHCRKAAGTAIHSWMSRIVHRIKVYQRKGNINKNWDCSVEEMEMFTYTTHPNFGESHYESILILVLREPIQRILSQYEFEWRWGCFRCDHQSDILYQELAIENETFSNMRYKTFMKYNKNPSSGHNASAAKYKFSNIEFGDFLRRVNKFEMGNRTFRYKDNYKIAFGAYLNNYYAWIFCCGHKFCQINRDFVQTNKIERCFEETISKLKSFDVLLTTEWMNDIGTTLYVNRLFWSHWVDLKGMYDRDSDGLLIVRQETRAYPHWVKDRGNNYMISNENENILRKWNYWDLKLYDVAKRIIFERIKIF
eukprot:737733_1